MTRLVIEIGASSTASVDVGPEECVVVGRTPHAGQLSPALDPLLPHGRRGVAVAAPSVSANHLAAWEADGELHLVDLNSRNGVWIRAPRSRVVRLPLGDEVVAVRLGALHGTGAVDAAPDAPEYTDGSDFGDAVAAAVRAWLQRQDMPVRAWASLLSTSSPTLTGMSPVKLANGQHLIIQPERTADITFDERMTDVCRFVSAQNALYAAEQETRENGMILASPAIRQVHRRVVELGMQSLASIVLVGPSGTGKERLSEAFHRSLGRSGPLITINCATLSRERFVADLFGAEAGAYTDAKRATVGAVERADGGTLFLDEIGELPLDVQPMLLRFLESGEYQRLGAVGRSRFADVRIVAATNRDLRQLARDGMFREDLFFRLALEIIEVPPLRARWSDIEAYLRAALVGDISIHDALTPEAIESMKLHAWSGNFRELVNFTRRVPRMLTPSSLDASELRRLLDAGSLQPSLPAEEQPPAFEPGVGLEWLERAAAEFKRETGVDSPVLWSDVATFVEHYLKPWALAHLGGVSDARSIDDVSVPRLAEQLKADRGTVQKQLRRYFESRR